jgi:hypothetical protein
LKCWREHTHNGSKRKVKFVARQSQHIKDDITRGWSSWNFGQDGFEGTSEELGEALEAISDEMPLFISGMEIWPSNKAEFEIKQLYPNYWVVVDNENAAGGLSCVELSSENLKDAIEESATADYFGDGDSFDPSSAKLVWSSDDGYTHIFEIH